MRNASIDRAWFGDRMEQRGLGVRKMASLVGMHPSALSRTLNGERRMRVGEVQRIATVLGCSVEEVLAHLQPSEPGPHSNPGFSEGQTNFKGAPDMTEDNEEYIVAPQGDDPLFGCMAGTLTLLPDVDYTAPADPDWGKVYED